MDQFDDSQNLQILEDNFDEQYVPASMQSRNARQRSELEPPTTAADDGADSVAQRRRVDNSIRERAPILIVERQTAAASPDSPSKRNNNNDTLAPVPVTTVPPALAAEKSASSRWWDETVSQTVAGVVKFFVMALAVFLSLVIINPPFIQVKRYTFDDRSIIEQQPASLQKAAGVAAIAGLALIFVPPIWDICSSRFFPDDIAAAAGFRKPSGSVRQRK